MNSTSIKQALPTKKLKLHAAGEPTMSNATQNRASSSATSALPILNVAFDVGSQSLNWSMELGHQMINGQCDNTSRAIRETLGQIMNEASQFDYLVLVGHVAD
jgi:hypothetical protein